MAKEKFKVLKCTKHKKNEYYVEVEANGRKYSDMFSLPGLKINLKRIEDKKSIKYRVLSAMLEAINQINTKEVHDALGTDK
jgi:hypothetical protein